MLKYGVKSAAMLDEVKEKIRNSKKGKNLSEEHKKRISSTLKEGIQNGEIVINTSGLKNGHIKGEFSHSEETKNKLSKVREGKKYEDLFEESMAKKLKEMHRKKWSGSNNPNYVEDVTDDELCYVIRNLISGKTLNEIIAHVGKSHYKIKQRLSKEGVQNVQHLKREDTENFLLTQILQKYENKN